MLFDRDPMKAIVVVFPVFLWPLQVYTDRGKLGLFVIDLDYSSPKVDVFAWTKSFGLADSTDQIHDFFPNLTMPAWSMQTQPPPLPDISTPSICRLQNDSCSFFHVIPTLQKSGGKLNVCRSEIIWSRACKEFRVTFKSACRKSFLATRQLELVIKGMSNE